MVTSLRGCPHYRSGLPTYIFVQKHLSVALIASHTHCKKINNSESETASTVNSSPCCLHKNLCVHVQFSVMNMHNKTICKQPFYRICLSRPSGQQLPGVPGIGCLVPLWQHDMIFFFNENKKEQIHFLKHMVFAILLFRTGSIPAWLLSV